MSDLQPSQAPIGRRKLLGAAAALTAAAGRARAQPGGPVRIGVLTDETGPYADASGSGSTLAVRMAAADFGGTVLGMPVEVVHADTQNKPDIASSIARQWFDNRGVDLITDLPVTPVAAAVQQVAREKGKSVLITAAAASEFTSKTCSLTSTHWADDTHALSTGTATQVTKAGGKTWFFITVDMAFGHALEQEATAVVRANGGQVLGSARFPIGNGDFASLLLQAQSSGAQVIGLASVGNDLVNLIKQAGEFGIGGGKQILAGFLIYITDVHALTPDVARGFTFVSGFYWNQNDQARAWAKRFFAVQGTMPTRAHAAGYAGSLHFLKAMQQAGTRDAVAVNKAMRSMPIDYFGRIGSIRADGRALYDLTLYRIKAAAEVKLPWDYYQALSTIPPADAFLPINSACSA